MSSTSSSILLLLARQKQQNFSTNRQSYCVVVQGPASSPATKAALVNPSHLFVTTTGRIDKRPKPTTSGASHSSHRPFFSQLTPQHMSWGTNRGLICWILRCTLQCNIKELSTSMVTQGGCVCVCLYYLRRATRAGRKAHSDSVSD
jgi:hypothetical protein